MGTDSSIPTLGGVEHISMTVPDLEEATQFFAEFFGCTTMYTMGPFTGRKGSFMRRIANADVRTVVHYVRVMRSPYLNVEMFTSSSPTKVMRWPDMLDIGGWHVAAYVDDMDAAVEYMQDKDVYILGEGKKPTGGPEIGEGSYACHCMTEWGFHFELLTYPNGRAYMETTDRRMWNPAEPDNGAVPNYAPRAGSVPGFRGFEHVSITVPDLDEASEFFEKVLGCERFYDLDPGPMTARRTSGFGAYANVDVRANPTGVRLLRTPYLNLELVECPPYPGQNRTWPGMHDVGGWHLAFYVDDVDAALDRLEKLDLWVLGGKKPAYLFEAGDDAYTVHGVLPWGFYFELVTYPHGRYLADEYATRAWHPSHPDA